MENTMIQRQPTKILMPKTTSAFTVDFNNFGGATTDQRTVSEQIVSVQLPEIHSFKKHINSKPIEFVIRDDVSNIVMDAITSQNEKQIAKKVFKKVKKEFDLTINQLDLIGNVVSQWLLEDCMIMKVVLPLLTYGPSTTSTITVTISFGNMHFIRK